MSIKMMLPISMLLTSLNGYTSDRAICDSAMFDLLLLGIENTDNSWVVAKAEHLINSGKVLKMLQSSENLEANAVNIYKTIEGRFHEVSRINLKSTILDTEIRFNFNKKFNFIHFMGSVRGFRDELMRYSRSTKTALEPPGGVVIFNYRSEEGDEKKFDQMQHIPDDWHSFVRPAWEYLYGKRADLNTEIELRKLLEHENPFIVLHGARELAKKKALKSDEWIQLIRSNRGLKQAILLFIVWIYHGEAVPDWSTLVLPDDEVDLLKGVALSLKIGMNFGSFRSYTHPLLLKMRLQYLGKDPELDEIIREKVPYRPAGLIRHELPKKEE